MRPHPPKSLLNSLEKDFLPAPELEEFVRNNFLNEDSKLFNFEHLHLKRANIGYLWTNAQNVRQMKQVVGTAEIPQPPLQSSMWAKARYYYQLRQWFGREDLDFLITLDANYTDFISDVSFCAVLDHELYHCAQKLDEWGMPKFNKETGKPVYGLRGHDVEEFVGIVRRYGPQAGAGDTVAMIEAALQEPEVAAADISRMCGTCSK